MGQEFALGKRAFGFCDRCGHRCLLSRMRGEFVRGAGRNNRVCPSCYDPDHPQNFQGMVPVIDAQAVRDPRPDVSLEASRAITPGPYTMDNIP